MGRDSILSQRENQYVLWTQITRGRVKQGLDLEMRLEVSEVRLQRKLCQEEAFGV